MRDYKDIAIEYSTKQCKIWLSRMQEIHCNQSELARSLGVNRAWISRVLQGKDNLSLETIARIDIALGLCDDTATPIVQTTNQDMCDMQKYGLMLSC